MEGRKRILAKQEPRWSAYERVERGGDQEQTEGSEYAVGSTLGSDGMDGLEAC